MPCLQLHLSQGHSEVTLWGMQLGHRDVLMDGIMGIQSFGVLLNSDLHLLPSTGKHGESSRLYYNKKNVFFREVPGMMLLFAHFLSVTCTWLWAKAGRGGLSPAPDVIEVSLGKTSK